MLTATVAQRELAVLGLEGASTSPLELAQAYRGLLLGTSTTGPVFQGLKGSVDYGMANQASVKDMSILGKTGTASNPGEAWTHGWFAGALPNRLVIVIYVPHGDGGAAALLAHKLFQALANECRHSHSHSHSPWPCLHPQVPPTTAEAAVYRQQHYWWGEDESDNASRPSDEDNGSEYNGDEESEKTGKLDANGVLTIQVPTRVETQGDSHPDLDYTLEAGVTDAANREITGRGKFLATYGTFRVNVEPVSYAVHVNEAAKFHVAAVDYDNKPVSTKVRVQLVFRHFKDGKTERVDGPAVDVTTDAAGNAAGEVQVGAAQYSSAELLATAEIGPYGGWVFRGAAAVLAEEDFGTIRGGPECLASGVANCVFDGLRDRAKAHRPALGTVAEVGFKMAGSGGEVSAVTRSA